MSQWASILNTVQSFAKQNFFNLLRLYISGRIGLRYLYLFIVKIFSNSIKPSVSKEHFQL